MLEKNGLWEAVDINGKPIGVSALITCLVFAVTSANHHQTRRNPLPLYQRAMMIQDFSSDFSFPSYLVPIDDIGQSDNFAEYTLKKIEADTESNFSLNKDNTIVLCSSPVMKYYQELGFRILPVERLPGISENFVTKQPWQILEEIALSETQEKVNDIYSKYVHPATKRLWTEYGIVNRIRFLFKDNLIGDDGDLTESRDYNTYVREMDEIAELKFNETKEFIRPGRIGDIGCAVGSWIKLATEEPSLFESDFYGVEIARKLFDICQQRKENGDFQNTNIFFLRKNAVTGLVFPKNSMRTIHTSSLTHEIESYGSRENLLSFIKNRYDELLDGGVWINRDVLGPENKDEIVYLWLNDTDGLNEILPSDFVDKNLKKQYLDSLSTYSRFFIFQNEFRKKHNYNLSFTQIEIEGKKYLKLKLKDACEFLSKKDYTDNWDSEMHESFCFWSFSEWKEAMRQNGFQILAGSSAYANPWIIENRYVSKAEIYTTISNNPTQNADLIRIPFPVTNMLLVGVKQG
ncbi:MAG: transferase [Leptospira sp.]|nr:transferase [Leptospira sp.]